MRRLAVQQRRHEVLLWPRRWCVYPRFRNVDVLPHDQKQCFGKQYGPRRGSVAIACRGAWGPSRPPRSRTRAALQVLLVSFVIAAGGCGQASDASPEAPTAGSGFIAKKAFWIFRGHTERFPSKLRRHLAHQMHQAGDSRFRPYLVQRAPTAEGVAWVFLVRDSVCVAQGRRGAVACEPVARAVTEGVSLGVFSAPTRLEKSPHDFRLLGLAPNGVGHVDAMIGAHRQAIAVRNNVFFASGDRPILIKTDARHQPRQLNRPG
jgi:hypothetical protein